MGATIDAAVTAIRQSEEKAFEKSLLVKSNNTAEQKLLEPAESAENFASLSKGPGGTSPAAIEERLCWILGSRCARLRISSGDGQRSSDRYR